MEFRQSFIYSVENSGRLSHPHESDGLFAMRGVGPACLKGSLVRAEHRRQDEVQGHVHHKMGHVEALAACSVVVEDLSGRISSFFLGA